MKALHPGVCGRCDHPFDVGTEIVRRAGGYVHADCAGVDE